MLKKNNLFIFFKFLEKFFLNFRSQQAPPSF